MSSVKTNIVFNDDKNYYDLRFKKILFLSTDTAFVNIFVFVFVFLL